MLKRILYITIFISTLITTTACEKLLFQSEIESNQEVFDYIWDYAKTYYCCSDIKGIDWEAMYESYAPQVDDDMGEEALFNLVHTMLLELEDGMVSLTGLQGTIHFEGYCAPCPANFDAELINTYYKPDTEATYTMLGDVAYINSFGHESFADDIHDIGYVTDKFILDLRNTITNPFRKDSYPCYDYPPHDWNGPRNWICANERVITTDSMPHRIKTSLTDEPYMYQTVFCGDNISRNGVVLMNRHTLSAASALAYVLFKRQNLNTIVLVGDTTGGGNFNVCTIALSNGWLLSIPRGTLLPEDGTDIYEGVVPNVFINDDPTTTDTDEIIEKALELLN